MKSISREFIRCVCYCKDGLVGGLPCKYAIKYECYR